MNIAMMNMTASKVNTASPKAVSVSNAEVKTNAGTAQCNCRGLSIDS